MLHKIIFLSLSILSISTFGMEQQALAPWVQKSNTVGVRTALKSLNEGITITDASTVADLKVSLFDLEGIPTQQQVIHPLFTSWWTLKLRDYTGPVLQDNENIKQIMTRFNTNRFILFLSLRQIQNQNNNENQNPQ